jgi:hypothetical protein
MRLIATKSIYRYVRFILITQKAIPLSTRRLSITDTPEFCDTAIVDLSPDDDDVCLGFLHICVGRGSSIVVTKALAAGG